MSVNIISSAQNVNHIEAKASSNSLAQDDYNFGPQSNYSFANAITCANEKTRKLWARAYCFLLNYNHEEAIACFQRCTDEDPSCAMAWWGVAYSLSPTYNWPPGLGSGYDAIQEALNHLDGKNELEIDLIKALATRHSKEARDSADPTAMKFGNDPALGPVYCDSMASVYKKYKSNQDVTALYVEGLMNLKPWELWKKDKETGDITPSDKNTLLIMDILEQTFKENGYTHPGLCHLYIHAMELSPFPERALTAANALRTLMPDAGHLVHMASHIDSWMGSWDESIAANTAGVTADDKYVRQSGNDCCFYKFYRMHNHHFIVWSAMWDGRYGRAMEIARKMEGQLPAGNKGVEFMLADVIPMGGVFLEAFVGIRWHVMIRFGRWEEILSEPLYTDKTVFACGYATQHYARGIAYASKGDVRNAELERDLFKKALQNPALKGRVLHNNVMYQDASDGPSIFAVNEAMLDGEIEYRKQFLRKKAGEAADFTLAFSLLRHAVKLELGLKYDEPWGIMQPVRHALGALLLEQGELSEAENVYRADLNLWKDNMWSLLGLKLCLEARLKEGDVNAEVQSELAKVKELFAERSKRADIVPAKTCFCAQNSLDTIRTGTHRSCCGKTA